MAELLDGLVMFSPCLWRPSCLDLWLMQFSDHGNQQHPGLAHLRLRLRFRCHQDGYGHPLEIEVLKGHSPITSIVMRICHCHVKNWRKGRHVHQRNSHHFFLVFQRTDPPALVFSLHLTSVGYSLAFYDPWIIDPDFMVAQHCQKKHTKYHKVYKPRVFFMRHGYASGQNPNLLSKSSPCVNLHSCWQSHHMCSLGRHVFSLPTHGCSFDHLLVFINCSRT